MPVMISQNFDVEAGVVNGCTGKSKCICYHVDSDGNWHAISCVIYNMDTTGGTLPQLPKQHVVALQDTVDMTFIHPFSKTKCTIKHTQIPPIPAFSMTAYKAQSQTLSNVIIDLQSCQGTEAPYVMALRVTSLQGLLILRPFDKKKIQC